MHVTSLHKSNSQPNEILYNSDIPCPKTILISINRSLKIAESGDRLIRFEDKKESYLWVQSEAIVFVKSADHYVKSLIQHQHQKKWALRHCTIKDLLPLLNDDYFIRLNRFYIINRYYFSHVDEKTRKLFFKDGFCIDIPHGISRFMLDMLGH
jgi:DNA-binding LytR/AlgR family response regulator